MKSALIILIFYLFSLSSLIAQEIIENPDKPLNQKAGRILVIEEEFRITDESGEFYFKYPRNLKISPEGQIFITDENQILKFDEDGNFKQNFFKKGQGPGEFSYIGNYCFQDDAIILHNRTPNKMVWLDFNGKLLSEYTIQHDLPRGLNFVVFTNGSYYFFKYEVPYTEGKFVTVDSPQVLLAVNPSGNDIKELMPFIIKLLAIGQKGQGAAMFTLNKLIISPYKGQFLFVSHTSEYLIKLYDIEKEKVIRSFKREYKRVKPPKDYSGGSVGYAGKVYSPPRPDYLGDINNLFASNELLWVQTSTQDDDKGYLFDIFDYEGKFIDSFFINLNGTILTINGNSIFVLQKDEDELLRIVKYIILDKNYFH